MPAIAGPSGTRMMVGLVTPPDPSSFGGARLRLRNVRYRAVASGELWMRAVTARHKRR